MTGVSANGGVDGCCQWGTPLPLWAGLREAERGPGRCRRGSREASGGGEGNGMGEKGENGGSSGTRGGSEVQEGFGVGASWRGWRPWGDLGVEGGVEEL